MTRSSRNILLILTFLATLFWFAGSWWYYSCKVKKTCENINFSTQNTQSPVIDTDGDGLSDLEEKKLGTNPLLADSDQDGVPDNEEIGDNLNLPLDTDHDGKIDALDQDDDNDGLSSLIEGKIGTNHLLTDTDQDGFSDSEEVGRNPKRPIDTDGDGIHNALDTDDDDDGILSSEEILLGTNFLLADSDADGLSDSIEIGEHIDKPLDSDQDGIIDALDANNDSDQDNDGLTDQVEALLNTNPQNYDTDGDGISDFEEVGSNVNSPLDSDLDGIIDALDTSNDSDSDSDGLSDAQEQKLGSNPTSVDSDNDGINDKLEVGNNIDKPLDTDNDGILNINDPDDDNDQISTKDESQAGSNPVLADSDGDGISDLEEHNNSKNKENIPPNKISDDKDTITIEILNNSAKDSIPLARVYFPFKSTNPQLTNIAAKYFKDVVTWIKQDSNNIVLLTGHTDNIGSKRANLSLGKKRVANIREFLITQGANIKQIRINSKGEAEPIANNKTKKGRWKNRRVEIGPYTTKKQNK